MRQKTTLRTEIEALEQFFAAINRNDMQGIIKDFDPQIVRIEPEGFPTAGTYRGIAEVQEHITKGRGTGAEGTCEPEEFFHTWGQSRCLSTCQGPLEGRDGLD
jgi:uncharacterized protein